MKKENLRFLPVSLNITGRKIMLFGGGKAAFHKASILTRFVDEVTVVSPKFIEGFYKLPFTLIQKKYSPDDLSGAFLVYLCTEDNELNTKIKTDCQDRNILVSVCDVPVLCDFISPAIYKDGDVTVSVSTNARNVYQSMDIRNQIKELAEKGHIRIHKSLFDNGTLQVDQQYDAYSQPERTIF